VTKGCPAHLVLYADRVARHNAREEAERLEAKAQEAERKAKVAAERAARKALPDQPYTQTVPQVPKKKGKKKGKSVAQQSEHDVHVSAEQKALRAAAFDARQERGRQQMPQKSGPMRWARRLRSAPRWCLARPRWPSLLRQLLASPAREHRNTSTI
jgi:hypothetical protein